MSAHVLAIETSTCTGSVAVVCGGSTVYEQSFGSKRSHNSELFVPLGEALKLAGADLSLIVVGTGPGSYTGARIGIAAAQGLSLSLQIPLIGMSSLVAPAVEDLPPIFKVCGDARRGLFYIATVQDGALIGEIEQLEAEAFTTARNQDVHAPWFTFDDKVPLDLGGITLSHPSAVVLANLAALLSLEQVTNHAMELVQPVYLSAPFVTPAKVKHHQPVNEQRRVP